MRWSQQLVDGRDEDGRLIADRELVVSRGYGAGFPTMVTAELALRVPAVVSISPVSPAPGSPVIAVDHTGTGRRVAYYQIESDSMYS
jgi:hypothetical protein